MTVFRIENAIVFTFHFSWSTSIDILTQLMSESYLNFSHLTERFVVNQTLVTIDWTLNYHNHYYPSLTIIGMLRITYYHNCQNIITMLTNSFVVFHQISSHSLIDKWNSAIGLIEFSESWFDCFPFFIWPVFRWLN